MYPSGKWIGYWEQHGYGRQPMQAFELRFQAGEVHGRGVDIVGPFLFTGIVEEGTGRLRMTKQYLGAHAVEYEGWPDGEGSIGGVWSIGEDYSGAFQIMPVVPRPKGDEPIQSIG